MKQQRLPQHAVCLDLHTYLFCIDIFPANMGFEPAHFKEKVESKALFKQTRCQCRGIQQKKKGRLARKLNMAQLLL